MTQKLLINLACALQKTDSAINGTSSAGTILLFEFELYPPVHI